MIQRTQLPWKRRGQHHAQVHFPPLTGEEALLLVKLLERIERAIWRAHGDAMADFLGCRDPDDALPKEPNSSPDVGPTDVDDDTSF